MARGLRETSRSVDAAADQVNHIAACHVHTQIHRFEKQGYIPIEFPLPRLLVRLYGGDTYTIRIPLPPKPKG